jgi:predicted dehydrogenase
MGTHRHHHRGYVESYRKVQEGHIGRIVSANVYHNQGGMTPVRRRPEWTDMEYMFRNIFHWKWLTGDHIIDQIVHYMDVFTWFSHLKPLSALTFGSRLRETCGDIYDNFSVDFVYEKGIHVHGMTRQIDGCDNQYGEIIHGSKGSWSSMGGEFTITDPDGNIVWKYDEEAAKKQFKKHDPYTLEHINLVNHLRSGKVINRGEITATASMACIMARESAYTGKMYTWDEMTQSDLNLMPSELTLGNVDMSKYAIPLPGAALVF